MTLGFLRRHRALPLLLIVAAVAGYGLFYTGKWRCWWSLTDYQPRQGLYLKVTPGEEAAFLGILREHAIRQDMWFAVDEYAAGTAGIEYQRYVTQSFNCTANITTNNDHDASIFGVYVASGPDADLREFERVRSDLTSQLLRNFEAIPEPD